MTSTEPTPRADVAPLLRRGAVPLPLTSLVGRDADLAAARRALGATRLLTLTGAGGSGKTRLGLELARAVAPEYRDGVVWVELGAVSDPALVPAHVAAALGLPVEGSVGDALAAALRDRALLLALDNCEHVVAACAALVTTVLQCAPDVRVLATSREALGVGGERAWLVPALALPAQAPAITAADALTSASVRLFVERACDVHASFELTDQNAAAVAQICRRLDGLPLAIELAAARVRVLAPEQIAARLDDRFRLLTSTSRVSVPRHRTLREAMEWSYNLLEPREQLVLGRLSVFAGGFTLALAEQICTCAEVGAGDVLDIVSALADKSLVTIDVRWGEARYGFLETVREYAAERLRATGEEARVRERHAAVFVALAESLEPRLLGGATHPEVMRRVDDELANMRAAFEWLVADEGRAEGALRLMWALRWYWFARGLLVEGRERLTRALAAAAPASTVSRGKALSALGLVCWWQGDYAASAGPLEEAVGILMKADEPRHYVSALIARGMSAASVGDHVLARATLDEAVTRAEAVEPRVLRVYAWFQRGLASFWEGDHQCAHVCLIEAEKTARALGHETAIAHVLSTLANLAHDMGERTLALRHVTEVLETARQTGERWAAVQASLLLIRDAGQEGDHARAARLLGIADGWRQAMGAQISPIERTRLAPCVAAARDVLGPAGFEAEYAAGLAMPFGEALDFCVAVVPPQVTAEFEVMRATDLVAPPPAGPPPLEIRALGTLAIARDGVPVPREAWRYARPRELLLYLLTYPEGRTREQIGLVFWRDATAAQVKNNFHVTLHQVRKALGGTEWIAFEDERYTVNWSLGITFDAAVFARDVAAVLKERPPGRDWDRLGRALELYRGDFLEEEAAGDWHLEYRDHLRRLYMDGAEALAAYRVEREEYEGAIEIYRQLLARDPLHEPAYRQLLVCHARLGQRTDALRAYDRLVTLLRAELETEPEPATTALYQRVRRGEAV